MTGWMSGNRAWKVELAVPGSLTSTVLCASVPVCLVVRQAQDMCSTREYLCARRTANKMDRSSFSKALLSNFDGVNKLAVIGFAISNGCKVLHGWGAGGLGEGRTL